MEETWWKLLVDNNGATLGINESWAGIRVAWNGTTTNSYHGANIHLAAQARIDKLGVNGKPDYIFVFGGTNNVNYREVPIGTLDYTTPAGLTDAQIATYQGGALNKYIVKTDGAGCFAREGVAKGWGKWFEGGAAPKAGDVISFCWNNKGDYTGENQDKYFSDHVGYVVSVSGNTLYTVEGNAGGTNDTSKVQKRSYPVNSVKINGYFRPNYPNPTPAPSPAPSNGKTVTVKGKTSVIRDDAHCAANKLVTVKVGAKLT